MKDAETPITSLAALNGRANIRHTLSPLDSVWRDRHTGETLALLTHHDGTTHVALFGEGLIRVDGSGPDARSAYRAAYRQQRLRRHDPADLLRQIATLRRVVDADALLIHSQDAENISLRERLESAENAESAKHRRARYAAAIRAHRAMLAAQRERYEESLRACRRSLLNALNQRNAVASRITTLQAMVTEARSKSPELRALLDDLTTDDIETIVRLLLEHVARSAEYHRRATAAEARAAELQRGQQSLIAAAKTAGFEYTVVGGAVCFTATATQDVPEISAEPSTDAPTGGETPSGRVEQND
ncbi:MAG: hypothetical protein KatS3mg051_1928 [Anaerolineae bacterium]|nr:MAG: hypothetical protein KatS3mg051_1928 [Anaerolineae bacterium]